MGKWKKDKKLFMKRWFECCDKEKNKDRYFARFNGHMYHQNQVKNFNKYAKIMPIFFILFQAGILFLLIKFIHEGHGFLILAPIAAIFIFREIISLVFSRRLSKKILDPIQTLTKAVKKVSEGHYGLTIDETCPENEVGQLIQAFNHMSLRLKESEELKKKYELNRKNLIAGISHDLKTPMTSIMGYVQGIQEGVADTNEKMNKYMTIIYQNAVYTNRLINDLFLFSKLDIQQLEFDFVDTPIKAYMDDLMTELNIQLKEQSIGLTFVDKVEDDYILRIDGKRIRQVILNIINNAIKYNDKDVILLSCSMIKHQEGIQISIRDNGAGIESSKIEAIFDRFYRAEPSRNKDIGGTGLGLAIAKELVKAHHGDIWAESKVGDGTVIHFTMHNIKRVNS